MDRQTDRQQVGWQAGKRGSIQLSLLKDAVTAWGTNSTRLCEMNPRHCVAYSSRVTSAKCTDIRRLWHQKHSPNGASVAGDAEHSCCLLQLLRHVQTICGSGDLDETARRSLITWNKFPTTYETGTETSDTVHVHIWIWLVNGTWRWTFYNSAEL
jgi:hypothetical protein